MIPVLEDNLQLSPLASDYLDSLSKTKYRGEMCTDYPTRLICATDNSVYQVVPQAVLYPRNTEDLNFIFQIAQLEKFHSITFSPRGGGTGTNGQSLNQGIILDLSKHMNHILETNLDEEWVRVQPGVVLDQLNSYLKPLGYFFAPMVSTSSRATLGGMVSTDACGKGSRIYGKTSDHILDLDIILCDSSQWIIKNLNLNELEDKKNSNNKLSEIYSVVDNIVTEKKDLIESTFPKLSRFLTGYNLSKVKSEQDFNLNYLLAGSEGSLCVLKEMKLKITAIPKHKHLFALQYDSFDKALEDAQILVEQDPLAIETVDEKIISLAKKDPIWFEVKHMLESNEDIKSVNLVEFCGENVEEYQSKLDSLVETVTQGKSLAHGYYLTKKDKEIGSLWELRKKGVGLLGNCEGDRRPIPFVEDTAVPPEHLYAYIEEFRALLDSHNLSYGMFGHVDVGCLHVRPALDMRTEQDEKLFKEITEGVLKLVKKYGGVLWAEHGKGFRSEYSPEFFGEELYSDIRRIKQVFDPHNRLNPGKIATPIDMEDSIIKVDEAKTRGQFDRTIQSQYNSTFEAAHFCNGNGACYHYSEDEIMCPSYKVTRNRIHSPKGRAGMLREWSRLLSLKSHQLEEVKESKSNLSSLLNSIGSSITKQDSEINDFSKEVYDVMSECLACKACATQCPIKVDIPEYRSKFLAHYHERYPRPVKDFFVANLEKTIHFQSLIAPLINEIQDMRIVKWAMQKILKLEDAPKLSHPTLKKRLSPDLFIDLHNDEEQYEENSVILAQDAFTTYYEAGLVTSVITVLQKLGIKPKILPYLPNGKPWHVKGYLKDFEEIASKNAQMIKQYLDKGFPVVGIEPSVTLTYLDEYKEYTDFKDLNVQLIQSWLVKFLEEKYININIEKPENEIILLGHCTEKTAKPSSQKEWQNIFDLLGLDVRILNTGCCGMAGTYGHESEHKENSKKLYQMSWGKHIKKNPKATFLATGFSCRSQVKRFENVKLMHPLQYLSTLL